MIDKISRAIVYSSRRGNYLVVPNGYDRTLSKFTYSVYLPFIRKGLYSFGFTEVPYFGKSIDTEIGKVIYCKGYGQLL